MMLAISRNKDPKASAPYLSLLNLSLSPFSDHAGEAFFYADPLRAQYLDMLQHLVQYSDEVLLVSGAVGSGKTELLERFLGRAEEHWRTCHLEGGERLEADSLFSRIAKCFQLELGSGNLLETMQGQLSALQEQQLPVLLIDDAQALSDDALELVMHLALLEGEHGKLIRVLMFADSSLDARLASERFGAMPPPHRQELHELDEEHTAAYLEHRLHAAGYRGEPLFSARDVKQLQHQAAGLPGRLNEIAHAFLLQRLVQDKPKVGMRRYLQMGLAASAVIGTVLGLNNKINSFLAGGEPGAMTVTAPERPVIRLADAGNPWAVVIRDGESIQINCGAPGGTTVGVRPLMTAAADVGNEMPMNQPIMRDVTPVVEESAVPAQEQSETVAQATKQETEAASERPPEDQADKPEGHGEKAATEVPVPTQVASNDVTEPPLVVKQHEDKLDTGEEKKTGKTEGPVAVKLEGVSPSPVPAGKKSSKVVLKGSGFRPGSKVAVSHAGRVQVLPQTQVAYVNSEQLDITITPGEQASDWAVQVSTPDNRRSNVLRFRVEPQVKEEESVERVTSENVVEKPAAKPMIEKGAGTPVVAETKPPKAEKPVAKVPVVPAKAKAKSPSTKAVSDADIHGYDWYARQPKSNFTLQLLASEKQANVEAYTREHKLQPPVGEFVMDHNGKRLYAVTQGSYPDRVSAEKAAAALPSGMKPWVRSMSSVQQVMKREQAQTKQPATVEKPVGSGERYKDTAWVWSQNPNHYTVQLSAASSEQAIEADMRRISLPGEMTVVQTLRDGKPWYALIYGSFATKEAARGTIERLPAKLRQAGPWPRSFASLQDEISRSNPAQ